MEFNINQVAMKPKMHLNFGGGSSKWVYDVSYDGINLGECHRGRQKNKSFNIFFSDGLELDLASAEKSEIKATLEKIWKEKSSENLANNDG